MMKFIEAYDEFYGKKFRKNKSLTFIKEPVEIRLDIEAVPHVLDRQIRHGLDKKIEENDIIETVEESIEELTIALMQNKLNVGERFAIMNKKTGLNIIAVIDPDENNFILTIITVMIKQDFSVSKGTYVLSV